MSEVQQILFSPGTGLNYDDDFRFMQPGDGTRKNVVPVDDGGQGLLRTIRGNALAEFNETIEGDVQRTVGACYSVKTRSVIYFLRSRTGEDIFDSIIRYNVEDESFDVIIREEPLLNFGDRVSARVIDDILIWTHTRPRAINIEEAINFDQGEESVYTEINDEVLDFIRYAPVTPPTAEYAEAMPADDPDMFLIQATLGEDDFEFVEAQFPLHVRGGVSVAPESGDSEVEDEAFSLERDVTSMQE
jgi:hypothetical protein